MRKIVDCRWNTERKFFFCGGKYTNDNLQINDFEIAKASIYSNPAKDYFVVNLPSKETSLLQLLNVSGQIILEKKNINTTTKIATSALPKGVYFVRITTANQRITEKLFIQ
ncbi:T9SS type A sorting domain-containing protein [Vaginella massiliensis]|uniref:T9SS type A sorting domain-containing protein n=1 Tax=Vaginella massiliensis TaxID=1816680 RepID=UPI000B9C3488|nr:T9SS type A sorting domain-containing protein [Vaginella massiliensis]